MSSRQDRYLAEILRILRGSLGDTKCRVYLFGSRAGGRPHAASDFDLAVDAPADIARRLGLAREMLEESNIPLTVDLVELRTASDDLRRRATEQGNLLWSN